MSSGFFYRRVVRFADTDMAGVGHFASIISMVEEAWHAWLGKLNESVHPKFAPPGAEAVGWPMVSVQIDFRQPVHFGDEITVLLAVERLGARSIKLRFTLEGPEGEFATGSLTTVCTTMDSEDRWKARPVPRALAEKLTAPR